MKQFIFVLTCCFLVLKSFAQIENSNIVIGTNHTIKSSILNQDREIQIYLPEGYNISDQSYPVLYILDGQWYFLNGITVQKSTRSSDYFPDMIVVGIQTANPLRRSLYGDNRDDFFAFLENEVIAYVDSTYRTTDIRILFGWENAAYFTSYAILNKKQLFNAAIGTNGAYATEEEIDAFDALENSTEKYLYIAGSTKDIYSIDYSEEFSKYLREKNPKNLVYKSELFNEEVHESLAYLAIYFGLKHFYHNYPSLNFSSIKDFKDKGGMEYLASYFKDRGERFGLSTEIDDAVKNTLIWLAWNRDDFENFQYFMTEFKEVLSTKRYDSGYWQNRFGQFYLKHKDYDNAIKYFEHGIAIYPNASQLKDMYNGLGDAYSVLGNKNRAKKVFKKAAALDKTN